jgi:thiamine biosynthesis lipoprotein ApbE
MRTSTVKGWAVERVTAMVNEADVCVNAGDDVNVRGTWRLGSRHLRRHDVVAVVIEVTDLGVATSGAVHGPPAQGRTVGDVVGPTAGPRTRTRRRRS